METHSSILPGESPRTEEPGGLQSMESQRFRHNWANFRYNRAIFTHTYFSKLRKKIEKEKRNLTPDGDASAWCKLPHGNNTAFSHKNIFQDSIDFYKINIPFFYHFFTSFNHTEKKLFKEFTQLLTLLVFPTRFPALQSQEWYYPPLCFPKPPLSTTALDHSWC